MNLALFDFDGTTTHLEMFTPFLNYSATPLRSKLGWIIVGPFYACYRLGWLPAHIMRPIASYVSFKGRSQKEITALGKQFVQDEIVAKIRPEALSAIEWHKQQGDRVILVSASLDAYLAPWCQEQGIELLCSELSVRNGKLTGRYLNGDCSKERKVERVKALCNLDDYDTVYAYGDTPEDFAMLAMADVKTYNWQRVDFPALV